MKKIHYLFEVSWEVCNKVGGINTVIATKTEELLSNIDGIYIAIGPDIAGKSLDSKIFIEDNSLFKSWREKACQDGFQCKIGHWNIEGSPTVILINFSRLYTQKDQILYEYWLKHGLDSLAGGWDYIEPVLFGYEAGRLIEHFYKYFVSAEDNLVVHVHEWLTGSALLYLKEAVPQACRVFTTHATILGRSIANSYQPLYTLLNNVHPEEKAKELQVQAKFNIERLSAQVADVFTTVSEITGNECIAFLGKEPDIITPNGFKSEHLLSMDHVQNLRKTTREILPTLVGAVTGKKVDDKAFYILTSGRYEFHNKGIDLFLDALGELKQYLTPNDQVVAIFAIPAYHAGVNAQIAQYFNEQTLNPEPHYATHYLFDENNDQIIQKLKSLQIFNDPKDPLQIIFIPSYLDGNDGLLNMTYYDFLAGMDLTVFPSYYEPWGYTPMESIAYGVPTITSSLAGFGRWVQQHHLNQKAVTILERNDYNYQETKTKLAKYIYQFLQKTVEEKQTLFESSIELAKEFTWKKFITYYLEAYEKGLSKTKERFSQYKGKTPQTLGEPVQKVQQPTWRKVLVKPQYPQELNPLLELMRNLWWTWHPEAEELFSSIHPDYWEESEHNPLKMLEMLSLQQIQQLAKNNEFLVKLQHVYNEFKSYMEKDIDHTKPSVAYFCMEYGFHASLKLYSGGLGVLAGDYLKEASDQRIPLTGVGLLFRYGYFHQILGPNGEQINQYIPQKFSALPLIPIRESDGTWKKIKLTFPGRHVYAKLWKVQIGRIELILLDTDIEENSPEDRSITHQLYGGDSENRLKQEILLGIGGVKALKELGKKFDVYHINEGHAAFSVLKRIEDVMQEHVLTFQQALELVKSQTIFTTHTPVAAGHDMFSQDLLRMYFGNYIEKLHISWKDFVALGTMNPENKDEKFSMSILALKCSTYTNGVSKIHGKVTRQMFLPLFPGYFEDELYIKHVTNAVHLPTWLHPKWQQTLKNYNFDIYSDLTRDPDSWEIFKHLSDDEIWNLRITLKKDLVKNVKKRLSVELVRRQESPRYIVEILDKINENALWFGFARRFATYKRAHLLLKNTEKLNELINQSGRPVCFVFAGKAHPNDIEGQKLIEEIIRISRMPEFRGKILFLENYDMDLAHLLVSGVDVWINTPTRPLEASGTSGMKATMNGTLNVSVLDGWWAEGYKPGAGWALEEKRTYTDQTLQDELDAETLYNIIQDEIIPTFFHRNDKNIPTRWIQFIRNAFTSIAPHFVTTRMLDEYFKLFYLPLQKRYRYLTDKDLEALFELTQWKRKILRNWNEIFAKNLMLPDSTQKPLVLGEDFQAWVELYLGELTPRDIKIELIFGQKVNDQIEQYLFMEEMKPTHFENNVARFEAIIPNRKAGVFDYAIRITPYHDLLPHRQDFPLVKWI